MPRTAQIRAVASFSRSRLDSYGAVDDQVDGGGVVAALGPGPLPALGVDRLGRADPAQQLVGAVLASRASSSSQVDSPNRSTKRLAPSLSNTARWRLLLGRVPVTAWLAAWGSAAATQ
jgi:hypothetical protein